MADPQEIADLIEKIRLGEDSSFEFKRVDWDEKNIPRLHGNSVAQEIAAFANTIGGVLVFGVDDKTRDVLGVDIDKLDLLEQWVLNHVASKIDPEPALLTRRIELPDRAGYMRPVLRVDIPRSLFVHKAPGGYYRRQGSAKREMTPQELQRLFQARGGAGFVSFDEMPVYQCRPEELQPDLYERYLGDGLNPVDIKLRKIKLVTKGDDGAEWASVAGCLTATLRPSDWIKNAYVQCVAYAGVEKRADDQQDARDADGPLDQQIFDATEFVLRNTRVAARKVIGRVDVPQYDTSAVFEAIANAVAHRDYSIVGSPIQVHLFADRLEIISPGALPNSQSIESIALRTATRNELVTNLLARSPVSLANVGRRRVMEKRGEGVPQILAQSEQLSGHRPRYELIGDNALRLTIYPADPRTSPLTRGGDATLLGDET